MRVCVWWKFVVQISSREACTDEIIWPIISFFLPRFNLIYDLMKRYHILSARLGSLPSHNSCIQFNKWLFTAINVNLYGQEVVLWLSLPLTQIMKLFQANRILVLFFRCFWAKKSTQHIIHSCRRWKIGNSLTNIIFLCAIISRIISKIKFDAVTIAKCYFRLVIQVKTKRG